MTLAREQQTIVALATAPGRSGIGVIRLSGPAVGQLAQQLLKTKPTPRYAHYGPFFAADGAVLDVGIALYFPAPDSLTGEDVLELQAHGGPVILQLLLTELFELGCQPARPGEFSERAFLNNKVDLAQAEAIADLIDAQSQQAARAAVRSLQGEFSARVKALVAAVTELRTYVEAAIDFADEDIEFLSTKRVSNALNKLISGLQSLTEQAHQGSRLRDGLVVVIAGPPNAGKSSLLNFLVGEEQAIVSDTAGTTRDVIRDHLNLDGVPLHISDTAGLRATEDSIERQGIERAWQEMTKADLVLFVLDASQTTADEVAAVAADHLKHLPADVSRLYIRNKIDQTAEAPALIEGPTPIIQLSVLQQTGLDLLRQALKQQAGAGECMETGFIARQRHLTALGAALECCQAALSLSQQGGALDMFAEELRMAQKALGEITGEVLADDLLGHIFSTFCIGK